MVNDVKNIDLMNFDYNLVVDNIGLFKDQLSEIYKTQQDNVQWIMTSLIDQIGVVLAMKSDVNSFLTSLGNEEYVMKSSNQWMPKMNEYHKFLLS